MDLQTIIGLLFRIYIPVEVEGAATRLFNKVSMMFIIYFHASKNGTNLPDVKSYCNKMEQIFGETAEPISNLNSHQPSQNCSGGKIVDTCHAEK